MRRRGFLLAGAAFAVAPSLAEASFKLRGRTGSPVAASATRDFQAQFLASNLTGVVSAPSATRYYPRDVQPAVAFASGAARWTADGLVVESRKANRIADAAFAGAVVGVLGSGGAIPTGSERNSSFVFTVVSLVTDAQGNKGFRFKISRTGGSPSGTVADWRAISSGSRFAAAAIGAAFHGFAQVNAVSGAVSRVDALLNEQDAVPSTIYNYTDTLPLDGSVKRFCVQGVPRTVGNTFQPIIRTTLSSSTADFSVDITLWQIKCEDAASLLDISSWDTGATATEAPQVSGVTNGTYDVLLVGQDACSWAVGAAVLSAGYTLQLPPGRSLLTVKKAVFFPAGQLSFADRAARVDTYGVATWTAVPRMTQAGGSELITLGGKEWVVTGPDLAWSMQQASNRTHIQRYEVRPGDHWAQDVIDDGGTTTRERSEIQEIARHAYDTDVYISYAFYIEPGPPTNASQFCRIGQFHDDTIAGEAAHSNAMGTNIKPGDLFNIDAYYNPNPTNNVGQVQVVNYVAAAPIARGVWHRLFLHLRPSTGGTGRLEAYLNGVRIVNYTGAWGYNAPAGWYWKEGIYRFAENFVFAAQIANFELTTTDISARIDAPRQIA